jgi:hypothetical protein
MNFDKILYVIQYYMQYEHLKMLSPLILIIPSGIAVIICLLGMLILHVNILAKDKDGRIPRNSITGKRIERWGEWIIYLRNAAITIALANMVGVLANANLAHLMTADRVSHKTDLLIWINGLSLIIDLISLFVGFVFGSVFFIKFLPKLLLGLFSIPFALIASIFDISWEDLIPRRCTKCGKRTRRLSPITYKYDFTPKDFLCQKCRDEYYLWLSEQSEVSNEYNPDNDLRNF